ncbi:helix-turn-helix transcriptional regulator [Enterococcus sp.]|uniref:helix-turn-helix domain-containing protein n=1 Tax=Enterococcus sp. TaxID=35783 RepID=UPI0028AA2B0B|nr:helix-turn-helix transcriptional regulator [Enterococcus sp.]
MAFHKIIKEKRKQLGITQDELAKELKVSRSAISNWEIGRNYPDINTLIHLAQMYNMSLDGLFNENIELTSLSALDEEKEMPPKRVNILIVAVIIISLFSFVYVSLIKEPQIIFENETIDSSLQLVNFHKNEIKNIGLTGDQLFVYLENPEDVFYYVESGDDVVEVHLYKGKNNNQLENILTEGKLKIDLSAHELKKVNKILVYSAHASF